MHRNLRLKKKEITMLKFVEWEQLTREKGTSYQLCKDFFNLDG